MRRLGALLLVLMSTMGQVMAAEILAARSSASDANTRLVFEFDETPRYSISEKTTAGQLVLEFDSRTTKYSHLELPAGVGAVKSVELSTGLMSGTLSVALVRAAEANIFVLEPSAGNPRPRLVIDFKPGMALAPSVASVTAAVPVTRPAGQGRPIVVSIDAGHGGQDPGAIGGMGNYEKHVTLSIAKALAAYLNAKPGIRAELTRDADFFIPLQRRRQIARQDHKADIFLSIHADSARNRQASGASVFALSLKGAQGATSRFAQELAEQENKSDLIGGYVAESDDLTDMLAMMAVEGSLKHSLELGRLILQALPMTVGKLHSSKVEQAGFAVLKEPGMVSLLVETGFISNANEEALLTTSRYQRDVARAIGEAVYRFCEHYPVPGSWFDRAP